VTARRDPEAVRAAAQERERLRRWQALPPVERDRLERLLHGAPAEVSEPEQLEMETAADPEDLAW
jgi:hypothetical protein